MFSGGALSRFTVFALGIMPYISASIIMQLMTYVVPTLEAIKKEGEAGRRKITQYTRYGTLVLALFQSLGIALALEQSPGLVISPGMGFRMTARHQPGGRHDVPDVAGRADHRARPGQRHLDPDLRRHRGRAAERDGRAVRTGAHRVDEHHRQPVHPGAGGGGDLRGRVRRTRAAQDTGQLRQAPGRQQGLWWAIVAPAAEAEHVGRDPADLRVVDHPAAGHHRRLVRHGRGHALAEGHLAARCRRGSRSTCCCTRR